MNNSDKILTNLKNQKSKTINRKSLNESNKIKISAKSSLLYKSPLIYDQKGRASSSIQKSLSSRNFKNNEKSKTNFIQKNKSLTKFKKNTNPTKQESSQNPITPKNDQIKIIKVQNFFKRYKLRKKIVKSKPYSFLKQVYSRLKFKKLNKKFMILGKNRLRTMSKSENTESLIEGFKSINSDTVVSFNELISTNSTSSIESVHLNFYKENDLKWEILPEFKIKEPNLSTVSLKSIKNSSINDKVNVEYVKIEIDEISFKLNDESLKSSFKESDFALNSAKSEITQVPKSEITNSGQNLSTDRSSISTKTKKFLSTENKNNNSDNSERTSFSTSTLNATNRSLSENSKNTFDNNIKNLYEIHQEILKRYLQDETKTSLTQKSDTPKAFVLLPSLFDKHGIHLVQLFSNKIDETFMPSYVDPRLVGECLYQLDQRIFSYIFKMNPLNRRDITNGYQPLDVVSTLKNFSDESKKNTFSKRKLSGLLNRYKYLIKSFKEIGYQEDFHPNITAYLIMKYGLYPCLPIDFQIHYKNYSQFELLFRILIRNLDQNEKDYITVLYLCLMLMAFDDQEPIFRFE